jgi:hypothetical protein
MCEKLDVLVARCSRFSGWALQWEMDGDVLHIFDPKDRGRSRLSVCRMFPEDPASFALRELYGRIRHWAITWEERLVMSEMLGYQPPKPVPLMVNPFYF